MTLLRPVLVAFELVVGLGLVVWAPAGAAEPAAMAVIGDSLSTGAVTHPALRFDGQELWRVFHGETPLTPVRGDLPPEFASGLAGDPPPPQRLWPSVREYFGGPDWVWRHALQSMSRRYLDTAQYSWGYLLGLGLKVPPAQIMLAGEDGARMVNMPRHLDRILGATGGELPRRLFVFYTGNDLCAGSIRDITEAAEFAEDLDRGLAYLVRNGRTPEGGADVYVMSYLPILQLITSDSILAKHVHPFGGEMTCKELRAAGYQPSPAAEQAAMARAKADMTVGKSPAAWYFSLVMPPNPAGFCATLFAPLAGAERDREVGILANHIRDFRDAEQRLVSQWNGSPAAQAAQVRVHLVTETASLTFTGDDIAEDCFHLSVTGQAKVARAVLTNLARP